MFDSSVEIEVPARLASSGGELTTAVIRWPTDDEWAARIKGRKIIIRRQGRGISETVPPEPGAADLALYSKIGLNGSAPPMTAAEAARVLDALAQCDVNDVRVEGNEAEVQMQVFGSEDPVIHRMRIPSADQVQFFRRGAVRMLDLPYNQQELRLNPDAGARLYDGCGGTSTDYKTPIPALHKDAVAKAVIECVERQLTSHNEQNF